MSVSRDKRCLVWDVVSGKVVTEFRGHEKDVLSVWVNGSSAFTTGDDGRILIWNIENGELIKELGPFEFEVDTVGGSEQLGLFAIGRDDGTVMVYDCKTFELIQQFPAHDRGVKQVEFSQTGNYILTAGYDHQIKIWETRGFELFQVLESTTYQWERSLVWTPDEKKVIGASFGKKYNEWDVKTGKHINNKEELATPSINDLDLDDDKNVVTASDDGRLRLNGKEIHESKGILTNAAGISKNGQYSIWGDHAGEVTIVDTFSGKKTNIALNTGPVNTIYFDEYTNSFYVGTYGGHVHVISTETLTQTSSWAANEGAVKAVDVDDHLAVTVSAEGKLNIFDKNNIKNKKEYKGPTAIANDVFLDSGRNRIIVVSRDCMVRAFDIRTGRILDQHDQHKYSIKSVTVTKDGSIVSGDYWGFAVIWNIENQYLTSPFRVSSNGISALRSSDNEVFCSSYDGGIYKINNDKEVNEILRLFNQTEGLSVV
ncbi:WD40 repeat domain-containing protein [Virgibacillus xinjiangensis]|uniref:WD40 repeat domain-containing protein n=1 Tax=Virgibacillus xinjiangensis TaxID=393090 RepID=A0ABV7CTJ9_9BACI